MYTNEASSLLQKLLAYEEMVIVPTFSRKISYTTKREKGNTTHRLLPTNRHAKSHVLTGAAATKVLNFSLKIDDNEGKY